MNISELPTGTKLVWDAPEPYEGYTGRLYYPVIISQVNDFHKAVLIKCDKKSTWIMGEVNCIRLPNETELINLKWPTL